MILKSGKPEFFTTPDRPLFRLDKSKENLKGEVVTTIDASAKIYLEGNYSYIDQYVKQRGQPPKILFFGDNLLSDCFYAQYNIGWHSVAIVEEISERVLEESKKHEKLVSYQKNWGSFFFEVNEKQGPYQQSYWYNFCQENIKYRLHVIDCDQLVNQCQKK